MALRDSDFLEWPFFDAAHRQLAVQLSEWIDSRLTQLPLGQGDLDADCRLLVHELGQAGILRNAVPLAYGGETESLDLRRLCLIRDLLAQVSGLADFSFAMQGLGSGAISLFASEALKQEYLPRVASGEAIAAFALSEPGAGSDVKALQTSARISGDQYVLDGCKTWISNGGIADFYTLFARTDTQQGSRGISCFLVDADTPGLKLVERIQVMAPHPLGRLELHQCRVPRSKLIGEEGRGFKIAMATLDVFRSTVGAAALGFARRALEEASSYSKQRKLFGGYLADMQMTKASLGTMALAVDASALLVYRAAWKKDSGSQRITKEAAMAKLYATEQAQQVIDKALQLHGGMGVVSDQVVEKLYREIRALRIYEGASEVQQMIIGDLQLQQ